MAPAMYVYGSILVQLILSMPRIHHTPLHKAMAPPAMICGFCRVATGFSLHEPEPAGQQGSAGLPGCK